MVKGLALSSSTTVVVTAQPITTVIDIEFIIIRPQGPTTSTRASTSITAPTIVSSRASFSSRMVATSKVFACQEQVNPRMEYHTSQGAKEFTLVHEKTLVGIRDLRWAAHIAKAESELFLAQAKAEFKDKIATLEWSLAKLKLTVQTHELKLKVVGSNEFLASN
ncbi:hypothetical protein ACH5RR_034097 [Cinchona calisaya]|uniref:Uncharacterized protein n=1 Tax=Cinchona calisaya TaxID=153742 RepID=A0ABD2YB65_9GENT